MLSLVLEQRKYFNKMISVIQNTFLFIQIVFFNIHHNHNICIKPVRLQPKINYTSSHFSPNFSCTNCNFKRTISVLFLGKKISQIIHIYHTNCIHILLKIRKIGEIEDIYEYKHTSASHVRNCSVNSTPTHSRSFAQFLIPWRRMRIRNW